MMEVVSLALKMEPGNHKPQNVSDLSKLEKVGDEISAGTSGEECSLSCAHPLILAR